MSQYGTGLAGEAMAAEHLKRLGLEILATRLRVGRDEVDILARDGKTLCFIEVKHRPLGRLGSGIEAVTADKRARIRAAAVLYVRQHPAPWRVGCLEITRAGILYYPDILHEQ